jgi:hypothetical protein
MNKSNDEIVEELRARLLDYPCVIAGDDMKWLRTILATKDQEKADMVREIHDRFAKVYDFDERDEILFVIESVARKYSVTLDTNN